jgi:hypothetical protein
LYRIYSEKNFSQGISNPYHTNTFFEYEYDGLHYLLVQVDPNEAKRDAEDTGPRLDDLEFWHKLIALITSVIEEDKSSYGPVLNQFPQELNIGQVGIDP